MSHVILWILGFGTLWAGLRLFDDEALLIVSILVGAALVLAGLLMSPVKLQMAVEIALIVAVFHMCMECVRRGDRT